VKRATSKICEEFSGELSGRGCRVNKTTKAHCSEPTSALVAAARNNSATNVMKPSRRRKLALAKRKASPEWLTLVPEMPALHATRAEVGKEQRTFVAGAIPGRRQRSGINPRSNRSKELFSVSSISTIRRTGNIEFSDSLDFCSPRLGGSLPKCLMRRSLVLIGDRRRGTFTESKESACRPASRNWTLP
jgi:hypothetical protein